VADFDLFVIGGGSAGLSAAKRAAQYGAKVAIAEPSFLGGTCAARGCIPKKLMVYASNFSQWFEAAIAYGWSKPQSEFNWQSLMAAVNREIQRLDAVHADALNQAKITRFPHKASFIDSHTVEVNNRKVTADYILIAVGGKAIKPNIPGAEHALISDQMFHLPEQPQRFAIVGGGYIGVEFAGILQGLGSQVTQIVRESQILDRFDSLIRSGVQNGMTQHGIEFLTNMEVERIEKTSAELTLWLSNGSQITVDALLLATGRVPNLDALQLQHAGIELSGNAIALSEDDRTSQSHIYAVGDCISQVQLTPVAIAQARAFADRVFGNSSRKVNYNHIPSSVFGKPQAAFVGLTETAAKEQFGAEQIVTYCTKFTPLLHHLTGKAEEVAMKLVVERSSDRILGAHMVGEPAAEIIQAIAVALTAGLTKQDFDATMPLHPTTAEEMVTLHLNEMPTESTQPCWMC
jgi:glutathione reductase (NADPH)